MLLSLLLAAAGMAALAAVQRSERRRRGLPPLSPWARRLRQVGGSACIAGSLAAAVAALGPDLGIVYWVAAVGLAGLGLACGKGLLADRTGARKKPVRRRRRTG
ncbi:hypothetical protein PC39_07139 [Salinisphaera sp. PC39]|uniref:DUF3325 family protein n=1 Tax=Salinisphaera sp. PC39 TaxID=1304156 RepID=UPI0033401CA2